MFFVISILAVDNVTKTSIETSQHLYLRDLIDSMLIEMGNVLLIIQVIVVIYNQHRSKSKNLCPSQAEILGRIAVIDNSDGSMTLEYFFECECKLLSCLLGCQEINNPGWFCNSCCHAMEVLKLIFGMILFVIIWSLWSLAI